MLGIIRRFISESPRLPGRTHSESGSAIIEFLLVVPLLTVIIGGAIDFGSIFYERRMLSEAAYVGTIAAAKLPASTNSSDAQTIVNSSIQRFLGDANLDVSQFNWSIDDHSTIPAVPDHAVQIKIGRMASKSFTFFGYFLAAKGCGQSTATLDVTNSVDAQTATLPEC